jgi:ComF family protein
MMAKISPIKKITVPITDLFYLMYPPACLCCENVLVKQEKLICFRCLVSLPRTNFHKEANNKIEMLFWGRVQIQNASSYFFYQKGSLHHELLYSLKYRGYRDLGVLLGKMYALELLADGAFQEIDCIVPVPLHPTKERKRGFNQCEAIAEGISDVMQKPILNNNLFRRNASETQTRKGRWDRWQNVESIFGAHQTDAFDGKHILLVDDVVTTGATIEACATEILKARDSKVSILTLAYASNA